MARLSQQKISIPFDGSMWLLSEKVIYIVISIVVSVSLARHLEPQLFGRLNYLLALTALIGPFMTLGLNSILSREILRRPQKTSQIIGSAFVLRLIAGLIVAAISVSVAAMFLSPRDLSLFAILAISSICNAALVFDFWLQAEMAHRHGVFIRLLILLIFSAARLSFIYLNGSLIVFVILASIEFICLACLYLTIYMCSRAGKAKVEPTLLESKRLLRESRWLLLSGIAAVIYLKIDQVMLANMLDERAVGIYSVATRLSEVWYFIPAAIMTAFFPQLVKQKGSDTRGYENDLQRLNDTLFVTSFMVATVTTLSADWFLPVLFGPEYYESATVLVVHIWAGLFVFMRSLLSKWLIVENYAKLSLLSQVSGALVNVGLNMTFIPLYGPIGAAWATLISYGVAGYGVLFLHRNLWPMARIVTKSLVLPFRIVRDGRDLYKT
jgi:O-antigen/teichoic acid export membrane protein